MLPQLITQKSTSHLHLIFSMSCFCSYTVFNLWKKPLFSSWSMQLFYGSQTHQSLPYPMQSWTIRGQILMWSSNNTFWHILQGHPLLHNLQALSWPLVLVCFFSLSPLYLISSLVPQPTQSGWNMCYDSAQRRLLYGYDYSSRLILVMDNRVQVSHVQYIKSCWMGRYWMGNLIPMHLFD